VNRGGSQNNVIELEQMGSSDPPLAVHCLYGSRHRHIVAVVQEKYTSRVGLLAVFPLVLLLFTGLFLFVLPHATKWGSGRRTDRTGGRPHDDAPEAGGWGRPPACSRRSRTSSGAGERLTAHRR